MVGLLGSRGAIRMMKRQLKWSIISVIFIASILFAAWVGENPSVDATSTKTLTVAPQIDYRMPPFTLPVLGSNTPISIKDLSGKPIFINFWTSWCTYCRLEAPDIAQAYKKYGKKVVFLSVNVTSQDTLPEVQSFVRQYGVTWQVPLDVSGTIAQRYQVIAFPTSYFVSKSGVIEDKVVGALFPGTLNADLEAISR